MSLAGGKAQASRIGATICLRVARACRSGHVEIRRALLEVDVAGSTGGERRTVLCNARIYTAQEAAPLASAMAFSGDRITAVGSDADVRARAGARARVVDLHGRIVLPGLIDTHNHLSLVGLAMRGINIHGIASIADLLDIIRDAARQADRGQWIVTGLVGESVISHELRERRYPLAAELDAAAPENPVCIRAPHVGVLNGAAMKLLGLYPKVDSPPGGKIGRLEGNGGALDGRFYETAWHQLVEPRLPKPGAEDRVQAIAEASRRYAAAGMTGVCEHGINWDCWHAYQEADRRGLLLQNALVHLRVGPGSGIEDDEAAIAEVAVQRRSLTEGAHARLAGVKVFIDGGVALGTAFFKQPYRTTYGQLSHGVQVTPPQVLRKIAACCVEHDLQLSQHASGDAAIAEVLDVYDSLHADAAVRRDRFIIVHCQFPSQDDITHMQRLGVHVAAQTLFLYNMGDGYLRFQGERGGHAVPLRSLLDAGCRVGLGTDAPVNQYQPTLAMWHAQTRTCKATGQTLGAVQAISAGEALALYTRDAARFTFMEGRTGTLEEGRRADLAVFASDPLRTFDDIASVPTESNCTLVGGCVVHGALDLEARSAS